MLADFEVVRFLAGGSKGLVHLARPSRTGSLWPAHRGVLLALKVLIRMQEGDAGGDAAAAYRAAELGHTVHMYISWHSINTPVRVSYMRVVC